MKNSLYYKLSAPDRYICLSGAPIMYLKSQHRLAQFNIAPTNYGSVVISPNVQQNLIHDLIARLEYLGRPATYAFGSVPDAPAYELMIMLARLHMNAVNHPMPEFKWVDLGSYKDLNWYSADKEPIYVVVHGLSDMSRQEESRLSD